MRKTDQANGAKQKGDKLESYIWKKDQLLHDMVTLPQKLYVIYHRHPPRDNESPGTKNTSAQIDLHHQTGSNGIPFKDESDFILLVSFINLKWSNKSFPPH